MDLRSKLLTIQQRLKAPKNQYNLFGKYNYRNCEDILEALKPLLEGACLTISDEIIMVGNRFYVKATVSLSDNEGSQIEVSAFAREEESKKGMDGSQVTGAASSYARKYALNGLFLIDDTKDADNQNSGEKHNTEAKKGKKTENSEQDVPHNLSEETQGNIVFAEIADVTSKDGTTKGKPWKLYLIKTATGDEYGTFSDTVADLARSFKDNHTLAKIEFETTAKGNKQIVELATF